MRILLTGASGQLGQTLQKKVPKNIELIVCDRKTLDINDIVQLEKTVAEKKPEVIINTAAYTAVDQAEENKEKCFAINAEAVKNIAEVAKKHQIRVIHFSTDYVFNGQSVRPYSPDAKTDPVNVYGESKLLGEQYLTNILPEDSVIVRTAWVYAKSGKNFLNTILRLLQEKSELNIVVDQIGTPTSAISLAELVWQVVAKPNIKGLYHFTDAGVASWYDFAVAIQEIALARGLLKEKKLIIPVKSDVFKTLAKRPSFSVLDKQKIWYDLNIAPQHWRESLVRLMNL